MNTLHWHKTKHKDYTSYQYDITETCRIILMPQDFSANETTPQHWLVRYYHDSTCSVIEKHLYSITLQQAKIFAIDNTALWLKQQAEHHKAIAARYMKLHNILCNEISIPTKQ